MNNDAIKHQILTQSLKNIPFDGWAMTVFHDAAISLGHDKMVVNALFPSGLHDTFKLFSSWTSDAMLIALESQNVTTLRMHEKIALAIDTRIQILEQHKDCVRESAKTMSSPRYLRTSAQITWDCANAIWNWAGDTSTDYNRYTKRGLLSGVITSTMLYWLQDDSDNHEKTTEFMNRRIQNVLFIGKNTAPIIKPVASLFERFIVRKTS